MRKGKLFIILIIIFVLLSLYFIDKFTGNRMGNLIKNMNQKKFIEKNKDSMIITVYAEKNEFARIPIITNNEISIDWGDGKKEKFISKEKPRLRTLVPLSKDQIKKYNYYDHIILPVHKYSKKGKYNIVISGDTKGGMFGAVKNEVSIPYLNSLLHKEILNKVQEISEKEDKKTTMQKYLDLHSSYNPVTDLVKVSNIINFKNLNFKILGNLTHFFKGEINKDWIDEFKTIEVFLETFAFSDITSIPEDIFAKITNLRVLNSVFLNCKNLKAIPENLIKNLDKIEDISYCFSHCTSLEGKAPNWWNTMNKIKNVKTGDLPYLLCFNECRKLENFKEIPALWGGIIENEKNTEN